MFESAIVDFFFIFVHVTVCLEVKILFIFLTERAISPGHVHVQKHFKKGIECMDLFFFPRPVFTLPAYCVYTVWGRQCDETLSMFTEK